ncbi:MAG: hypothetical protein CMB80_34750 [Flammeovirgaceae bacterium]|nr:hypothetical protein [Flammeovirgaceae bacterium]
MKLAKGITRFTYDKTSFNGFRICLQCKREKFVKYISIKKEGGIKKACTKAHLMLGSAKAAIRDGRLVRGKLSKSTIKKVRKILELK